MQAFSRLLPLSIGCAAAAIMAGSAFAQTAPTRQKIAEGAWARSVNNTAISRLSPNSPAGNTIMALWQQHDVIPQGSFEKPMHLYRANGTYTWSEATGGVLTWSVPLLPIPKPNMYQYAADPSVVMTEDLQNWRFIVSGEASSDSFAPDAYAIATANQSTGFDLNTLTVFDNGALGSTRHARLGVRRIGIMPEDLDTVVMIAQNQILTDGPIGQVFLRKSVDSGVSWGSSGVDAWEKLTINDVPIVGFTSAPVFPWGDGDQPASFAFTSPAGVLDGAYEIIGQADDFLRMGNLDSQTPTHIDVNVGGGETYYSRSNEAIAGGFGIRPFPSITGRDLLSDIVYIVYQDFKAPAVDQDGNFDVFIVRGIFLNGAWTFGVPWRINDEDFDVKSDQFMPVVYADPGVGKQIHVAWYDTSNDLRGPNENVKIALYYTRLRDLQDDPHGDPGFAIEPPILLDAEAIDTAYLTNPKFLGDRMDMMVTIDRHDAIIVYMGTDHRPGHPDPTDETIFSFQVP